MKFYYPVIWKSYFVKFLYVKHKKRSSNKLGESVWHIKIKIQFYMISVKTFSSLWPTGKNFGTLFVRVKAETAQIFFLFFRLPQKIWTKLLESSFMFFWWNYVLFYLCYVENFPEILKLVIIISLCPDSLLWNGMN